MSEPTLPADGAAPALDARQLLRDDHRRIERLLDNCLRLARARSSSQADRSGALMRLGALLLAHAQLERELFYPALAAPPLALADAGADHDEIEAQFKRLNIGGLSAAEFGERVTELSRLVREHQAAEEQQLLALLPAADLQPLGARMALRRAELLGEQGED